MPRADGLVPPAAESAPASTPGRKAEEHGTAPGPLAATARPDGTFWGQVLKYCVYGIGTYHFNIGGVGNRSDSAVQRC